MNTHENLASVRHGLIGRRGTRLLLWTAGAAVLASTALGGSLVAAAAATAPAVAPSVVPTSAIVGTGLISCAAMTGEVGYTTPSISGGTATETISIFFQAKKCSAPSGTTATPVPKTVTGSMSFSSVNGSACPQFSTLGTGTLNLAYNYPPVAGVVIDPSVTMPVTVTQVGALWDLAGGTVAGSYPSTTFSGALKPDPIGGQSCGSGITSEYIIRGTLSNV
ncbi:MAG TPA: hypothetical protein VGH27_11775 [Streptosporangiaceae bacterium]